MTAPKTGPVVKMALFTVEGVLVVAGVTVRYHRLDSVAVCVACGAGVPTLGGTALGVVKGVGGMSVAQLTPSKVKQAMVNPKANLPKESFICLTVR